MYRNKNFKVSQKSFSYRIGKSIKRSVRSVVLKNCVLKMDASGMMHQLQIE